MRRFPRSLFVAATGVAGNPPSKVSPAGLTRGEGNSVTPPTQPLSALTNTTVPLSMLIDLANIKPQTYRTLYRLLTLELWRESRIRPPPPYPGLKVNYKPGDGFATFTAEAPDVPNTKINVHFEVKFTEPKHYLRVHRYCIWWPMDIFVTRAGKTLHFAVACAENAFFFRNLRVYKDTPELSLMTEQAKFLRENSVYDGPYLRHLEHAYLVELHEFAEDYGIEEKFVRHCANWGFYLEHVEYVRWLTNFMEGVKGPEDEISLKDEDVFTKEELDAMRGAYDINVTLDR